LGVVLVGLDVNALPWTVRCPQFEVQSRLPGQTARRIVANLVEAFAFGENAGIWGDLARGRAPEKKRDGKQIDASHGGQYRALSIFVAVEFDLHGPFRYSPRP